LEWEPSLQHSVAAMGYTAWSLHLVYFFKLIVIFLSIVGQILCTMMQYSTLLS
jgi:hypothetical protein